MKTYIFFCLTIASVGGGQLYLRNKVLYLKSLGWNVKVFSYIRKKIYINELHEFEEGINPKIQIPVYLYSEKEKNKVLDWMCSFLDSSSDEFIIESDALCLSSWAEALAERVQGRHLLYILDEHPKVYDFYKDYLLFKFQRNEFACITEKGVLNILPNMNITNPGKYRLSAFCNNAIDDVDDSHVNVTLGKGVKIGFLGRINKVYVLSTTTKLIEYIRQHQEMHFEIVYIGGSPKNKDVDTLKDLYRFLPNAKVSVTGYLCPVPKSFMDRFDFFISSAGSARATSKAGYLTVAIDGYKYGVNGILGITTNQALVADTIQYELKDVLDDLIVNNKYTRAQVPKIENHDLGFYFRPHMNYIKESQNLFSNNYYNFNLLNLPFKMRIVKSIVCLLGSNFVLNSKNHV